MINKLYKFFFPDDTKIKIECVTIVNYFNGKLTIHRKFYTFRSLCSFVGWSIFTNPVNIAKRNLQLNPIYGLRYGLILYLVISSFFDLIHIEKIAIVSGTIAFDAVSSGQVNGTSLTFNHTVSGSNTVLTVSNGSTRNTSPCTYNGVTMSEATEESDGSGKAHQFYLGNPTTGTNSVVITLGSSGNIGAGAVSFSGANSSSPLDNQVQATAVSNGTLTMTMTTNYANSFLVDVVHKQADPTPDGTQTLRWNVIQSDYFEGSTKATTTAGSYSMVWTGSVGTWGGSTLAIREFVASGPANLKSYDTNLKANIKSINTNLLANIKSLDTNV